MKHDSELSDSRSSLEEAADEFEMKESAMVSALKKQFEEFSRVDTARRNKKDVNREIYI